MSVNLKRKFKPDCEISGFQQYCETSGFQPYIKYGGWPLSCYEAGHDGNFDEKDNTLSARAFRVLQTLDTWSKSFEEFVIFYRKHKLEIDYICSKTWPRDFVLKTGALTFLDVCKRGYLQTAQWIKATWPNNINVCEAFTQACCNGHLKIAQWLKSTNWELRIIDSSGGASFTELFTDVCCAGHLKVAKWLKNTWPSIDHSYGYEMPFHLACYNGHLEVAQWLKNTWPEINHRTYKDVIFIVTCANGKLEVAQWLKSSWPDIDHTSQNNSALHAASQYGHVNVVEWLKTL